MIDSAPKLKYLFIVFFLYNFIISKYQHFLIVVGNIM
jgi:hypothetical protein